jgi:uncharacterized protein (TIGR03067 family)
MDWTPFPNKPTFLHPQQGIYEIDGDTLKLCTIAITSPKKKRPEQFASPPGSDYRLAVLKREKK